MSITNYRDRRLSNQRLLISEATLLPDLFDHMLAFQAQDYAGAKWSLGMRLANSTDAKIQRALAERRVVRSWVPRGTLHFIAPGDLRWMLALLAPRIIAGHDRRHRELGLDEATFARSNTVLSGALKEGRELTRAELLAVLEQKGISTQGQRAPHLLAQAALEGLICHSVVERNNPTYFALDGWLPEFEAFDRPAALAELARRYFISRGPATLQDFVWWSGLPTAEARLGLDAAKPELSCETLDGKEYWLGASSPEIPHRTPIAFLLPGFDEYLYSYRDRSLAVDPTFAPRLRLGSLPSPSLVIEGRIVGAWRRELRKGVVQLSVQSFEPLEVEHQEAVRAAAQRFEEFLGVPVTLED